MIKHFSVLLVGFSIFSILILMFAYVFYLTEMRKSLHGKVACVILCISLMLLQTSHYLFFSEGVTLLDYRIYCIQLTLIPAAFFFFGRVVIFPDIKYHYIDFLHFIPPILSFVIPLSISPAVAFLLGSAYTLWFAHTVFELRHQRGRFKFEMFFFGMFALMALVALLLGLSLPYIDASIFYLIYTNTISIAMLTVVAALVFFPQLLSDITIITEIAYAKSKLTGIDIAAKLQELDELMMVEKLYQKEDLNLAILAKHLSLSSHQLSELINTKHGYGFPRYMHECRIKVAKRLLINEPKSSILSISMMTGFKSQSRFYATFKEITGESPGNYRKKHL